MKRVDSGLRRLFDQLLAFRIDWDADGEAYDKGLDRLIADVNDADVVSSKLKEPWRRGKHIVAIDVDHPVYVVPSSTDGHFHLYIDVPGGIDWVSYMYLLDALADAGVIEQGYAKASRARGHSDLRLPWVKKGEEPGRKKEAA